MKICSKCGKEFSGYPAISRIDKTEICSECGIAEALEAAGLELRKHEIMSSIIRATYRHGMKVRLIHMDDIQAPPKGTTGTIDYVDDCSQIHVIWETGSRLALIPGEDRFEIVR